MFDFIKDNPLIFILIFLAIVAPSFLFGAMQVVFYIILGIIALFLILALIFRLKIRNIQNQMNQQMGGNASQGSSQRGGFYSYYQNFGGGNNSKKQEEEDVKIYKQRGSGEKKVSENVGDYVDFEEVD